MVNNGGSSSYEKGQTTSNLFSVPFQKAYGEENKDDLSRRHLVEEEATQVIELGSSDQVEEGSSENAVEFDNLKKEATSVLKLGKRLGLSF